MKDNNKLNLIVDFVLITGAVFGSIVGFLLIIAVFFWLMHKSPLLGILLLSMVIATGLMCHDT